MSHPLIGFIGTGVMGRPIAGHLLAAGYPVQVYNRTRSKAEPLTKEGARWCDSPEEVARGADYVLTMLGYPEDVAQTYFGSRGIFSGTAAGSILIDLTTSSPALAVRIAETAAAAGASALDAPVSGGDRGAREAALSIMVGGDGGTFERSLPLLKTLGRNIVRQGPPGSGQHTKMCNQIAIASGMIGVCEALRYAESAGLDPESVLRSISAGAAGSWSLSNLAPRILEGDHEPGFYVKHFIKDLRIALESADHLGLDLPGLALARQLYQSVAEMGAESKGTQALIRWYRR